MSQPRLFQTPSPYQPQPQPIPQPQSQYSWQYHYHKTISSLQGNEDEKQATIRKRILRYFGQFKLDSESYLSMRSDVDYGVPGVQVFYNRIMLYGVDFMTVDRCRGYFQGFLSNVRRVDDSHFMVEFRSQAQCLSAINYKNRLQKKFSNPQEIFKISNKGWIEMKPYHQFIFQRKLMARYATNLDRCDNISMTTKQSCIFAYSEAKRRFMKSLKEDIEMHDKRRENYRRDRKRSVEASGGQRERSASSMRSREKPVKMKEQQGQQGHWKPNHDGNQCQCQRQRPKTFIRSRSRSRSYDRGDDWKVDQQQKIRQSNFKFNEYLKRRKNLNQNRNRNSNKNTQSCQQPKKFSEMRMSQICNQSRGNYDSHVGNVMKESEELDSSFPDFTKFLQNLKLSDSKAEYSTFEIEDIEQ